MIEVANTMNNSNENSITFGNKLNAIVLEQLKLILSIFFAGCLISVGIAFWIDPEYESYTVFEIQDSGMQGFGLSKIGMIGDLMGSVGNESATQLLDSRELKTALIRKFNLQKKWKQKTLHASLKKIDDYYSVSVIDEDYFKVSVYHTNPDTAKMMVDFALQFFQKKQTSLKQKYASKKFDFYKSQLDMHIGTMTDLSDTMVDFMKSNKVFEIKNQAEQIMNAVSDVDKEILASTVELKSMYENYWNKGTVKYESLIKRIEALKVYRASLLKGNFGMEGSAIPIPELKKMPELSQHLKIMEKKLDLQQNLLALAIPQLEKYRLEMLDSSSSVLVLDPSFVPDYKTRPKRAIIILLGMIVAGFVAFAVATLVAVRKAPKSFSLDPLN